MKKIILTTTALFLSAATADASKLDLSVGGFADFQAGFVDNDVSTDPDGTETLFRNDTELHFAIEGRSDLGFEYGAVIELNADVSDDADQDGVNSDRTFLYLQGNFGKVEIGNTATAAEALDVDTANFAAATGGADGDFYHFIDIPVTPTLGDSRYLIRPDLAVSLGDDMRRGTAIADSTKISYYTPSFGGLQVGASYVADLDNSGNAFDGQGVQEAISAAVAYKTSTEDFDLALSYGFEHANQNNVGAVAYNETSSHAFGANIGFGGLTLGGSYGIIDHHNPADQFANTALSGAIKGGDASFYDIGAAYDFGDARASVTYFESEWEGDEFSNLSFGAEYTAAPGLTPYAEVNIINADSADGLAANGLDNEEVVIVGMQLNF